MWSDTSLRALTLSPSKTTSYFPSACTRAIARARSARAAARRVGRLAARVDRVADRDLADELACDAHLGVAVEILDVVQARARVAHGRDAAVVPLAAAAKARLRDVAGFEGLRAQHGHAARAHRGARADRKRSRRV